MFVIGLIESLFLAMGLYLRAFYLHYDSLFQSMSYLVDIDRPATNSGTIQIKARLIEAIQFHNRAKEYDRHRFLLNHEILLGTRK